MFNDARRHNPALIVAVLVVGLSCFRLAHAGLLWADEDYHLAAAINLLHGKLPYRDFWYDKPPLTALYYLLIGGYFGWPLRLLDAAYIVASCYVAYRIASAWWTEIEGYAAALLLAFFTTFYLPSAVIPFAADAVMLLPHLLAIDCALRQRPILAGCFTGLAFLANIKAVFVLASCTLFLGPGLLPLFASFALSSAIGLGVLTVCGAWPGYVEQVWRWGFIYAKDSPVIRPWLNGVGRTLNWTGFHLFPVLCSAYFLGHAKSRDRWRLGGWITLSFIAVALGSRFAPHYFLQLLPPIVIAASRGLTVVVQKHRRLTAAAAIILLPVPLVRFGPRYFELAKNPEPANWADIAMDLDSHAVARQIETASHSGDTLFVWGYRPDVYVYTRMVSDSRFWDSQPLTGVPADRHLNASAPIYGGPAQQNRGELIHSKPTWIVDGLGLLNPKLKIDAYGDLHDWLSHYTLVRRTSLSLIYRRKTKSAL